MIAGIAGPALVGIESLLEQAVRRWAAISVAGNTVIHSKNAVFVSRRLNRTVSTVGDGRVHTGDVLFVSDNRLDNRAELGTLLSIPPADLPLFTDNALLQRLLNELGPKGIAQALGAFAFAQWDEKARRLILGRDCVGFRALFFHHGDGFVAFASDLNLLLALPFVPREIDENAVAHFLALNLRRPIETFYKSIERVPSRTLVSIDRGGVTRNYYWSPDFAAPPPFKKEVDYIERARELFDQAVARATADTPQVAVMASGGLDSSAIAATAVGLGQARSVTCFTIVPPPGMALDVGPNDYLSERDKVEALARMYAKLDVQFCEEGVLHSHERNPVHLFIKSATPVRGPANFGAFAPAYDLIASAGYPVCLVGDFGNFGLTWGGDFSLLSLLRSGRAQIFLQDFIAASKRNSRGIFRTLAGDVIRPSLPRWVLRIIHRPHGRNPDDFSRYSCLNPALSHELSLTAASREDGFDPQFNPSGWEPARFRAHYLFDHNQVARDFRASAPSVFGYEMRDPHADRTLLEFLLRVPEPMYRQNGIPRSFARKVLAGRLPPEILNETRTGTQGVTWFQRLDIRRTEIAAEVERLEASPLASRLLDVPRMKRILDDWPKDAQAAETRMREIRLAFARGLHVGQFIRWVEGGNG